MLKKEKGRIYLYERNTSFRCRTSNLKYMGFRNTFFNSIKMGVKRGDVILITSKTKSGCLRQIKDEEGRYVMLQGRGKNIWLHYLIYIIPQRQKNIFIN